MEKDIKEVMFSEEEIQLKVEELGKNIEKYYKNREKDLVVIGILKGANVFLGDLVRKMNIPLYIDFMAVSSYGQSTESSGVVKIIKDLDMEVENKDVLIVEDIIDTGLTLHYLTENLGTRKANSIKIVTLLNKEYRRKVEIPVDFVGFEIPDEFIVGYGIDYGEKYRNLPYIATLKSEVYE